MPGTRFKIPPAKYTRSQIELSFDLRDAGMRTAVEHANQEDESWSDKCYQHLSRWIKGKNSGECFLVEDFRLHIQDQLSQPPSLRAFGGVVVRAYHDGLIRKGIIRQVNNPKAHRANAQEWIIN